MHKLTRLTRVVLSGTLVATAGWAASAAAAETVVAQDSFTRTVADGWAQAESGGSWSSSGHPGALSVSSGKGRMALSPGWTVGAALANAVAGDTDFTVDLSADQAPTGGGHYFTVIGRGTEVAGYRAQLKTQSDGSAVLSLRRTVADATTVLSSAKITRFTVAAGTPMRLRMAVAGSSSVTVRAKVWEVGKSEPTDWDVTSTDSAGLPSSGPLALQGYVSSSAQDDVTFTFDNVDVTSTAAQTVISTTGKPDAANTGVPTGTVLKVLSKTNKPYSGDTIYSDGSVLVINTPNAVYDGWQFDMFVEVRAPGVKFTNSLFRGTTTTANRGLLLIRPDTFSVGQPSATVTDSTFIPRSPNNLIDGVRGSNFTLRRVEITKTVDGVFINGTTSRTDPNAGNVTIENSWIHDLPHYDDNSHSDGTHNDGVQIIGGHNIRISGSRIDGTIYNAGMMITNGRNNVYDVSIVDNWLAGGACTINVSDKDAGKITGLTMSRNQFTRGTTRNADCAMIVTDATRAVATATANTWHNGSTPAPTMSNGG